MAGDGGAYAQPTPLHLYVHDDLSDEVAAAAGESSVAAGLARELLALLAADRDRVRVLTLADQVERVAAQGPHAPFELTLAVGRAGERVAQALHARTAWFPRVRRVGITREEDGAGGYRLVSTEGVSLAPAPARSACAGWPRPSRGSPRSARSRSGSPRPAGRSTR